MTTTNKLRKQIEKLAQRREKLTSELEPAIAAHTEAQERLLANDQGIVTGTVALHYSTVSALREAISEIDQRVSQLQQQLAEVETEEQQAETRKRMTQVEKEMAEKLATYHNGRRKGCTTMEEILRPTLSAWHQFRSLQREFESLSATLGNPVKLSGRVHDGESFHELLHIVDAGLQVLLNIEQRGTREQRKARVNAHIERQKSWLAQQTHRTSKIA